MLQRDDFGAVVGTAADCTGNGRRGGVGEDVRVVGMVCVGVVSIGESVGQEVGAWKDLAST